MNKRIYSFLILCMALSTTVFAQLQSPAEFLGYELGEQWTPHYKVLGYFQHVAAESPMVSLQQYGTTNEDRELVYATVTTADNHGRIEEIRLNNLRLAGLEQGEVSGDTKAVVWLSYNVHGNETSSSEAAMNTVYKLITEKEEWLADAVVIIDPMLNPDGRDRYVNWYRSVAGDEFNALPEAREHHEPWPGGRTNHYYFDLNRDWAWQTQVESRQRVKVYNQWMPHVHVDFHEQSYNSPYYFAPAAKPFHTAITDWQRDFQQTIGGNHADYFDKEGWLYFTREVFDLFYPSYGDTWPTFNGAIGMTYEQAGHSLAGLGIVTAEGDTLTLDDRLTHHTVTGLSTVEITAKNKDRVVEEFARYYDKAQNNPEGKYKAFVISQDNNPDKIHMLLDYLKNQDIEVGIAGRSGRTDGFDFETGVEGRVRYEEGDYVVSTYQPKGTLVRVLFEPDPELVDSLTYDIISWESHYAYGLKGVAVKSDVNAEANDMPAGKDLDNPSEPGNPYAFLSKWNSLQDLKFLARLLDEGVKVRFAQKPFSIKGENYGEGSLIITRNGNFHLGDKFGEKVVGIANKMNREVRAVETGMVDSGSDFGASSVEYLDKQKVALLSGEGTSSNMVGHIWHYFDRQINYPVSLINLDDIGSVEWKDYDVLILPALYGSSINDRLDDIKSWVREGGTLIALGSANSLLAGKEGFSLKRKEDPDSEEETDMADRLKVYGESSRDRIQDSNAGSVFEVDMDTTHPLAFGYDERYLSLKLGSAAYEYLENGWNVGVAKENALRSGFVGNKALDQLEESLSFGVQNMGRGAVVYMIDNPLFRGFWHNGKLLFGNAVFFVGK